MRGPAVDRIVLQMMALFGLAQGVAAGVVVATHPEQVAAATSETVVDIWSNYQLLGVCFLGASLGTALRIAFLPLPELKALTGFALVRAMAMKATVSMTCGLGVTPMLLRYLEWHPDRDTVVFSALSVAFLAEVTLSVAMRVYQVWLEKKASDLSGQKQ